MYRKILQLFVRVKYAIKSILKPVEIIMARREGYSWLLKFHNILYSKKQECPYKKIYIN